MSFHWIIVAIITLLYVAITAIDPHSLKAILMFAWANILSGFIVGDIVGHSRK